MSDNHSDDPRPDEAWPGANDTRPIEPTAADAQVAPPPSGLAADGVPNADDTPVATPAAPGDWQEQLAGQRRRTRVFMATTAAAVVGMLAAMFFAAAQASQPTVPGGPGMADERYERHGGPQMRGHEGYPGGGGHHDSYQDDDYEDGEYEDDDYEDEGELPEGQGDSPGGTETLPG